MAVDRSWRGGTFAERAETGAGGGNSNTGNSSAAGTDVTTRIELNDLDNARRELVCSYSDCLLGSRAKLLFAK